jgi:hypothetical protein
MTTTPRYNEIRTVWTMQPLGVNGRPINGGNHYANAETREAAVEWAETILTKKVHLGHTITGVEIVGNARIWTGTTWDFTKPYHSHREVITARCCRPVDMSRDPRGGPWECANCGKRQA